MSSAQCTEDIYGPKRDSIYVVIPLTIIYLVIFITGTLGNVSTCLVISKNKTMHSATNFYLFSLAISDLLLLLMGLPPEIYSFWSRYPYIFGSTFCFMRGLFAEISGNATVLTITAFTIERYLAICHPFLSHTMLRLSRVVKFIIFIWMLSICFAIPQAMPLKVIGDCKRCIVVEDKVIEHAFEVSTLLFFVAPMTLIIVLYILIGLKLKSSRVMEKRMASAVRNQNNSSRNIVKMLGTEHYTVAVVVAFFICWAPFHIQRLFSIYQKSSQETMERNLKIYEILTYISGILYYISATINPILYNIMSVKFREAFKETFFRCSGFGALRDGEPQLTYIALPRSTRGAYSITDSDSHDNTAQTNTSTHKHNGSESLHSLNNQRIENNQDNYLSSRLKDLEISAKKDEVTYVNEPQ